MLLACKAIENSKILIFYIQKISIPKVVNLKKIWPMDDFRETFNKNIYKGRKNFKNMYE